MKRILVFLFLCSLTLPAADLSGNWPGVLQTPRGTDDHNPTLRQSGSAIAGAVAFSGKKWEIRNVSLSGQTLTFEVPIAGATPLVLFYDLRVNGDEISGKLTARQGAFPGGTAKFRRER
jgi:hypothetical protein